MSGRETVMFEGTGMTTQPEQPDDLERMFAAKPASTKIKTRALKKLKDGGLRLLLVGYESGNQPCLRLEQSPL